MSKRLRELVPDGYEAVKVTRGHYALREIATGDLLRLPDGRPLHVACSPSDYRADKNIRATIRRVLEGRQQ